MNHIKRTLEENKAWCGENLDGSFHFKDTEAAVINGVHGSIVPCQKCVEITANFLYLSHVVITEDTGGL